VGKAEANKRAKPKKAEAKPKAADERKPAKEDEAKS
jgi:hypothetical protein